MGKEFTIPSKYTLIELFSWKKCIPLGIISSTARQSKGPPEELVRGNGPGICHYMSMPRGGLL
jgi:hypothetical protein